MTPLWVRLWHWAVAALFVILVLTGVVLTYSRSGFALMNYGLADTLHQVTGIIFSILCGVFLVVALAGGYWRGYQRRWQGLGARMRLHATNVVEGGSATSDADETSRARLEASRGLLFLVQQFLYILSVVILSPLLAITGVFLLYPELAPQKVVGLSGLWTFALAHYWAGLAGALFLLFHIYIATIGGLRRMIKGR